MHIVGVFDPDLHPEIVYPAALLTGGAGDPAAARDFLPTRGLGGSAPHGVHCQIGIRW